MKLTDEELMKLADAYANAAQGYNMATLNKARAALEAALSAKQGEQEAVTILPDGSAFGVMTFPLPADHWLCREREYATPESTETVDLPPPFVPRTVENLELVRLAAKWAIRAATNCGKENDFDPDAMVQNFVYATLGPYPKRIGREDTHPSPSVNAQERISELEAQNAQMLEQFELVLRNLEKGMPKSIQKLVAKESREVIAAIAAVKGKV